jgi:hypothetical protein
MDEWEEKVIPHFDKLVECLRPTLIMDTLRARRLINKKDYSTLGSLSTEQERSQKLLHDILPSKGPGTLDSFCDTLLDVDGQEYVVTKFLRKQETRGGSDSFSDRLQSGTSLSASSTSGNLASQANIGQRKRKRKLCTSSSHEKDQPSFVAKHLPTAKFKSKVKTASFFFTKEHHASLTPNVKEAIISLCHECFGIDKTAFAAVPSVEAFIRELCPVYVDADSKLAVLILYGIKDEQVDKHRDNLEQCIITFLQMLNPKLNLPSDSTKVLEIITNCLFFVMCFTKEAFLALLCAMAYKEERSLLSEKLQDLFPQSSQAVLRIGGLPPLDLFNKSTDEIVDLSSYQRMHETSLAADENTGKSEEEAFFQSEKGMEIMRPWVWYCSGENNCS